MVLMSFKMTNAPQNAMQPGHGNHSGMQNVSTTVNDPRIRAATPKPPTVHNQVIFNVHFSHAIQQF